MIRTFTLLENATSSLDQDPAAYGSAIKDILDEVCIKRFGKERPVAETSEEARLSLARLVLCIITALKKDALGSSVYCGGYNANHFGLFAGFAENILWHLHRALSDPHPDIKKTASASLQALMGLWMDTAEQKSLKEEEASRIAEIGKNLVLNASHQHSRVRIASLNALEGIILCLSLKDSPHQGRSSHPLRCLISQILCLRTPRAQKSHHGRFVQTDA